MCKKNPMHINKCWNITMYKPEFLTPVHIRNLETSNLAIGIFGNIKNCIYGPTAGQDRSFGLTGSLANEILSEILYFRKCIPDTWNNVFMAFFTRNENAKLPYEDGVNALSEHDKNFLVVLTLRYYHRTKCTREMNWTD